MKLNTYSQKLRPDLTRIKIIHWLHFLCLITAVVVGIYFKTEGWWSALWVIFFFAYYRLYYRTVENLYYSFWTFSFTLLALLVYFLLSSIFYLNLDALVYLYLAALVFLLAEMYILSSPIYFPRVSWWEYDFRYRHDLKISVLFQARIIEGRLTDLRRGAGCVVLFEDLQIGEMLKIKDSDSSETEMTAEIMSKKEYTIGRGFTYGVKFHWNSPEEKKIFNRLCRLYKLEKSSKRKLKKFQMVNP
jgi:hypothetical protein